MMNERNNSSGVEQKDGEFSTMSPPSLKEMTLLEIAVSLFHENEPLNLFFDWNVYLSDISRLSEKFPFQEDLKRKILQIGEEIANWISFHSKKVLKNRFVSFSLFKAIPFMVWSQNSTVDYKKTALKMQSSSLSDCAKINLSFIYDLDEINYSHLDWEEILKALLTSYKCDDDDDILNKVLSNSSSEFKKKLTMTKTFHEHCERLLFDPRKSSELNTLKNRCFSANTKEKAEFEKQLIFSAKAIEILRENMRDGYFSLINARMDQYLSKEEDKNNLKKEIFEAEGLNNPLKLARRMFLQNNLDFWESLLRWYCGSNKNIKKYKFKMPVADIFDDLLNSAIYGNRIKKEIDINFGPINRFLRWYFVTPKEIEQYKCRKALSTENIPVIQKLLKNKNKIHLRHILRWFGTNEIKYNRKCIATI